MSDMVSEQVRHKQVCSATENSQGPGYSDIENDGKIYMYFDSE